MPKNKAHPLLLSAVVAPQVIRQPFALVTRHRPARGRVLEPLGLSEERGGGRVVVLRGEKVLTYSDARRMGQRTQRATNYTARSNIEPAQIFLRVSP